MKLIKKATEIASVRILPGVLNVLAIVFISNYLEEAEYGFFSFALFISGFIGNLLLGIVHYAVIPEYHNYNSSNKAAIFEAKINFFCVSIAGLSTLVALMAWKFDYSFIAACIALSTFMGILEVFKSLFRVKLKIFSYGSVAILQSIILLILLFSFKEIITFRVAILIYLLSYVLATFLALILNRNYKIKVLNFTELKEFTSLGVKLTVNNLSENIMQLSLRGSLLVVLSREAFGAFSFALDIAQRSIGVLVNLVGFLGVPRAYKYLSNKDFKSFNIFVRKTSVALLLSSFLMFCLIVIGFRFFIEEANITLNYLYFSVAAICIFINRLKKLIFEPVIVHAGRASRLSLAYAVPTVAVVPSIFAISSYFELNGMYVAAYLISYILMFFITWLISLRINLE